MPNPQDNGVELHGQFNIRQFAELLNLDPSDTTRLANFIRKHKTGQRPTYQEVGSAAKAFVGLVDADQELTNKAAIMLKRVDAEPKMEETSTMKNSKSVNEGIRVAKEGIEECWDDMGGQEMTQDENQTMSVTISMPGKNISVTTDSAEEIGSILRLAGINVTGAVAGDVDGDGDHDMADHAAENPAIAFVGAQGMGDEGNDEGVDSPLTTNAGISSEDGEEEAEEDSNEKTEESTKSASSWTDAQGNKYPATKVQGSSYGGNGDQTTDSEEDEEYFDPTNPSHFAIDDDEDVKEAKKPDADGDGVPDWADKKDGEDDNEAKNESAAILRLAGLSETKLANSPAGTSMPEPKTYDSLPSKVGVGAGHKDYGQNRANNQGENPMGMHTPDVDSVEEAFATAMGEYRKFVAENIARKK